MWKDVERCACVRVCVRVCVCVGVGVTLSTVLATSFSPTLAYRTTGLLVSYKFETTISCTVYTVPWLSNFL